MEPIRQEDYGLLKDEVRLIAHGLPLAGGIPTVVVPERSEPIVPQPSAPATDEPQARN